MNNGKLTIAFWRIFNKINCSLNSKLAQGACSQLGRKNTNIIFVDPHGSYILGPIARGRVYAYFYYVGNLNNKSYYGHCGFTARGEKVKSSAFLHRNIVRS